MGCIGLTDKGWTFSVLGSSVPLVLVKPIESYINGSSVINYWYQLLLFFIIFVLIFKFLFNLHSEIQQNLYSKQTKPYTFKIIVLSTFQRFPGTITWCLGIKEDKSMLIWKSSTEFNYKHVINSKRILKNQEVLCVFSLEINVFNL